MEMLGRLG
jgi:hypothetical protein